ncbi:MAG: lipopolysaccharide heptosyltransferase II [Candidatus Hydrogenedentota bacterium]|nr:MAG: lipopolysaccharide heptosyltransferase II [Candidatus Hydrogenedentota bacterium]
MHILVVLPNWLGDVAMCTPALRALHQRYPHAQITVAGRRIAVDVLEGLPGIANSVVLPARPNFMEMIRISRQLKPWSRDLAIVFPHSFRSALLAKLSGARRILGYNRGGRSWLLTDSIEPYREEGKIQPVYMAQEYSDLLNAVDVKPDNQGLELVADDQEIEAVRNHLSRTGPVVGFAPGAAFGPSKRWPAERYAAVANDLHERIDAQCVLMTGPGEEDTRDAFLEAASVPIIQCHGGSPTLARLKATISQLDLLIGNDSGPRHVAVAFDVPVICIMGSTKPAYSCGPYEKGEVLRIDVDCGPCQQPVCKTDHRCMTGISPELVANTAIRFLP